MNAAAFMTDYLLYVDSYHKKICGAQLSPALRFSFSDEQNLAWLKQRPPADLFAQFLQIIYEFAKEQHWVAGAEVEYDAAQSAPSIR